MKILDEVPEGIDPERIYGIRHTPSLPIVEMAVKKESFKSRQ